MRLLALIGTLAILCAVAAGIYLFGGFYNVAARAGQRGYFDLALVHIRDASIDRHAGATPPFALDDPATIRAGAREFAHNRCSDCHGAPGVERDAFTKGMNPHPPNLKAASGDPPTQVFWVVQNGIRMTAMPSFAKVGLSNDQMWRIVAYIKKFPKISPAEYKAWTAPAAPATPNPPAANDNK
jgi:mono/diheme cytochrome c family protein